MINKLTDPSAFMEIFPATITFNCQQPNRSDQHVLSFDLAVAGKKCRHTGITFSLTYSTPLLTLYCYDSKSLTTDSFIFFKQITSNYHFVVSLLVDNAH